MHTIMVLTGGFVLLFFCLLLARALGGIGIAPMAKAALMFIPIWFIAAAINLWVGVVQAGYSLMQELPIFVLSFTLPALAAFLLWWRLTHLKQTRLKKGQ